MTEVTLGGKRLRLDPRAIIGSGGEADIYDIGGDRVLKLYKLASDPAYAADHLAQIGATHRISEHQTKLPAFPSGLPPQVVVPGQLARSGSGRRIVGYAMPLLIGTQPLLRFGDRHFRESGAIDGNQALQVFVRLHGVVAALHRLGIVIADFNDLNVLVETDGQLHLVDADSLQFGRFLCHAYTARFVDPLICGSGSLTPLRPHNSASDWYAFAVMLHQTLLYAGPYGGVHRPATGPRLQHDARVLKRLGIGSPEVIYPKPALPLGVLPDELAERFAAVFNRDRREEFPLALLQAARWTVCNQCGLSHARDSCPGCARPGVVRQTVVIRGTVTATQVFKTTGRILKVTTTGDKLRYLYHEGNSFRRENDREVLAGVLEPGVRYGIAEDATLIGRGNRLIVLSPDQAPQRLAVDTAGSTPVFDTAGTRWFWLQNGQLRRSTRLGSDYVGDVLTGRTLFWAGPSFGLGFYQAGSLMRAFVFATGGQAVNDRVDIPAFTGQLIDATCAISDHYAWLLATVQRSGRLVNHCYVIDGSGTVIAHAEANQDEDSWLAAGIHGRFAGGTSLFAATDDGILRIVADNGAISVTQTFPDTASFVDRTTRLHPGPGGIYAVSARVISLLTIK